MDELRGTITPYVAGYEKQTLFGPYSRFFESAILHLCLAMAAVSNETGIAEQLI